MGDFLELDLVCKNLPPLAFMTQEPADQSAVPRLPLFSRCPITNEARLENPNEKDLLAKSRERVPFVSISNIGGIQSSVAGESNSRYSPDSNHNPRPTSYFGSFSPPDHYQRSKSANNDDQSGASADTGFGAAQGGGGGGGGGGSGAHNSRAATPAKPSLDSVRDNSIVALTNKFGMGKYWFKSACPMPDPRWPACHQLMIGPIPGDVEYSQLRSAFLAKGHTLHLFIQNNQAWLEKNQEKFGNKHVKFGYVVYTDKEVAAKLFDMGYVAVGRSKVGVKRMDGKPAVQVF